MRSRLCTAKYLCVLLSVLISWSARAFTERDVNIISRPSGLKLAGTLTLPDKDTPKAFIVTATGSGTQDRDETIFGKKPFKALAEHLANHGYAVLRMDDRGAGDSDAGDMSVVTTFDFVTDIASALAASDTLVGEIIPKGVFGHSEGGLIAEHLAAHDSNTDFIITFGAPAFKGDSLLMRQVRESHELAGAGNLFEDAYASLRRRYDLVMGPGIQAVIEARILAELAVNQPETTAMPQVRDQIAQQVRALCSPWMRTFLRHDPATDISIIKIPWLAINGSLDRQVTADNLTLIAELCPTADVVVAEGLNHIMLKGVTGGVDEYARLSGDADPDLLELITDWLDRRFAQPQ